MSLVTIENLSKSIGGRDLFRDLSLQARPGTRMALVGPNGCGKTTFLRVLAGEVAPDTGSVHLTKGARVGYVRQELGDEELTRPLLPFLLDVLPSWTDFWAQWEHAVAEEDQAALERLVAVQADLEHEFGYNPEHRAQNILSGLGFARSSWNRPLGELSGGWRERAKLARVLLAGSDILLLDEPTNHLDIEAVQWLESYLLDFEGILFFVAHDRIFLDRVAGEILFFGGGPRPLLRAGNFSMFLEWSTERDMQAQKQAAKLESEIQKRQSFVDRFRYKATKASQAQSRIKGIARLEEALQDLRPRQGAKNLSFTWPQPPKANRLVASIVDLGFSYTGPGHGDMVFERVNLNLYRGQRVALVGQNGTGKSTLLKLLAGRLRPDKGQIKLGSMVQCGYYSQHQSEVLSLEATVIQEIRRQSDPKISEQELRSVLGLFLLGEDFWEKKVGELSGGEKNRLVLSILFLARANFLILDEPTNHLDMESREALVSALENYSGTVLLVAHDRYLLAKVAETIWEVQNGQVNEFQEGYSAYMARVRMRDQGGGQPATTTSQRSVLSRRDQRRMEAEERNRINSLLKPKQLEYQRLERELEAALAEHEKLEQTLADPETYKNPDQLQEMTRAYQNAENRGEELMTRLAYLERDIQEIQAAGRQG